VEEMARSFSKYGPLVTNRDEVYSLRSSVQICYGPLIPAEWCCALMEKSHILRFPRRSPDVAKMHAVPAMVGDAVLLLSANSARATAI
jgi:hypothetical protein